MKDQERTPLRLVLRNFLNHIENLESQNYPDKSYDAEFQDLKLFSEGVKCQKEYSSFEGEKEVNRKKNRYKDILPFDLSRVVLNEYAGVPGSDYINANFIKGASGSPAYIASQGPLPSTVNDFWRMVVQCEVQVIVMACNEEEAGKAKCEKYWVDEGEEKQFGLISVKLLKSSTVCSDFSVRTMRLKYNNSHSTIEERTVCQLHYVAWPDHGVPSVVQPLLEMVRLVRDTQASETLPVLIHCSAGCGRTGTICAIDYVWGLLRTGKLTDNFSLLSLIREMRKQRIAMVQTKEQYVLVHQAVRELFKEQLCMIDSHPYENVDTDGLLIIPEEEHVYDTIEALSKDISEEKQDHRKEKDAPPPLPKKKQQTLFSSKKEKDVENLSAQQRAIHCMPKMSKAPRFSEVQMSDDSPKEPTTPKRVFTKPILSKGILRVPQLDTHNSKTLGTIKRSKSLKLVGHDDKQKLIVCSQLPTETKRRSSLESNIEESLNNFLIKDQLSMKQKNGKPIYEYLHIVPNSVPKSIKKYEELTMSDQRKPLVRSYTTLDMRTKIMREGNFSTPKTAAPPKVRLSRSNTQVDFNKMVLSKSEHTKTSKSTSSELRHVANGNPHRAKIANLLGTNSSPQINVNSRDKDHRNVDRPSFGVVSSPKKVPFSSPLKNITDLRKIKPRKIALPTSSLLKEPVANHTTCIPNSCFSGVKDETANFQHSNDKRIKKNLFSSEPNGGALKPYDGMFNDSVYTINSSPRSSTSNSSSIFSQEQQCLVKPSSLCKMLPNDLPLNMKFPETSKTQMDGKYLPSNHKMQVKDDFLLVKSSDKVDNIYSDKVKSIIRTGNMACNVPYQPSLGPHKRFDRAAGGSQDSGIYSRSIKPNAPFTYGRITGRTVLKPTGENLSARTSGNHFVSDGLRPSIDTKPSFEPSPSTSSQQSWEVDHCAEWSYPQKDIKPQKTYTFLHGGLQRSSANSGKVEDSVKRMDSKDSNYLSAPGVDIDKVAASISQKDSGKSSFMKVALEALNLRQPKHRKEENGSSKGSGKSEVFNRLKKKQQEYL